MKMRRIVAFALCTAFFAVSVAAADSGRRGEGEKCDKKSSAQAGKEKTGQGGDVAYLLASKELKLSEDQRGRLKSISRDFEKERILVRSELKVKRMELEELLKSYDVNRKDVEKKVGEMSDLNAGLLMKATISRLEARKVLTREQFEIAKELIDKKRGE